MQRFTFYEIPNYFSYFYSLLLIYLIEKIVVGRFLYGRARTPPTLAHLRVRSRPHHLLPQDAAKWALAPHGPTCQPHSFAGEKPLRTRPTTAPVTAQTRPLPLLRHHRSSLAKFLSTDRPPVTTPRHKDDRVSTCHLEPLCRLRCAVASHHRVPPVSAPRCAARR
jgi:hypothetical protein